MPRSLLLGLLLLTVAWPAIGQDFVYRPASDTLYLASGNQLRGTVHLPPGVVAGTRLTVLLSDPQGRFVDDTLGSQVLAGPADSVLAVPCRSDGYAHRSGRLFVKVIIPSLGEQTEPVAIRQVYNPAEVATDSSRVIYVGKREGSFYYRSLQSARWSEGAQEARQMAGHLALPNSAAENAYFQSLILGQGNHWIGLTDSLLEGRFVSATGQPMSYQAWRAAEPNNQNNEDGVEMQTDGGWNDEKNNSNRRYLIEIPILGLTTNGPRCLGDGAITLHYYRSRYPSPLAAGQSGWPLSLPQPAGPDTTLVLGPADGITGTGPLPLALARYGVATTGTYRQRALEVDSTILLFGAAAGGRSLYLTRTTGPLVRYANLAAGNCGLLATAKDSAGQALLARALARAVVQDSHYIGLSDTGRTGRWVWADGDSLRLPDWAPGQPDLSNPANTYVAANLPDADWRTTDDRAQLPAVLQLSLRGRFVRVAASVFCTGSRIPVNFSLDGPGLANTDSLYFAVYTSQGNVLPGSERTLPASTRVAFTVSLPAGLPPGVYTIGASLLTSTGTVTLSGKRIIITPSTEPRPVLGQDGQGGLILVGQGITGFSWFADTVGTLPGAYPSLSVRAGIEITNPTVLATQATCSTYLTSEDITATRSLATKATLHPAPNPARAGGILRLPNTRRAAMHTLTGQPIHLQPIGNGLYHIPTALAAGLYLITDQDSGQVGRVVLEN